MTAILYKCRVWFSTVCVCVFRSELPGGSTDEGLTFSCSELIKRGQVDYRVKVTNTGKMAGGVSALAFVSPEVRVQTFIHNSCNAFVGGHLCEEYVVFKVCPFIPIFSRDPMMYKVKPTCRC